MVHVGSTKVHIEWIEDVFAVFTSIDRGKNISLTYSLRYHVHHR